MDVIREDTVAALHRAMLVLREELEMKNRTITRLRRRKHKRNSGNSGNPAKSVRGFKSIEDLPKPVKTCLKSAGRSLEVTHYNIIQYSWILRIDNILSIEIIRI